MKAINEEDVNNFLNMEGDTEMLLKIDEEIGKRFDYEAVMEAHLEELEMLEEIDGYLETVKAEFDPKKHVRQAAEMVYTAKIDLLLHLARRFHPLSGYGRDLLEQMRETRTEFERMAGPMITAITAENLSDFVSVIPEQFRDEIRYHRVHALGLLRSDMNRLFATSGVVYSWEKPADDVEAVLRIHWFYVLPKWRRQGVANALIGELVLLMIRKSAGAFTFDIPIGDDMEVLGDLLTEWHFGFTTGVSPEFVCLLSDVRAGGIRPGRQPKNVSPIIEIGAAQTQELLRRMLKKEDPALYRKLIRVPKNYYDPELSCFIKTGSVCKGLLLVHKYESDRLKVEFIHASGGEEAANLLRFCAATGTEKYDRNTEFAINTETVENLSLFESLFPKQRMEFLIEGILTPVYEDEDVSTEDIQELIEEIT